MKEFKVGDKVFDLRYGNGVVTDNYAGNDYPIRAKFNKDTCDYTVSGLDYETNIAPSLYHGHDLIVEVKEPEYEYQILIKEKDGSYNLSEDFYTKINDFTVNNIGEVYTIFEPSKRLVKRG